MGPGMWVFRPQIRDLPDTINIWARSDRKKRFGVLERFSYYFEDHRACAQSNNNHVGCEVLMKLDTGHQRFSDSTREPVSTLSVCTPRKKGEMVMQVIGPPTDIGKIFRVEGLPHAFGGERSLILTELVQGILTGRWQEQPAGLFTIVSIVIRE